MNDLILDFQAIVYRIFRYVSINSRVLLTYLTRFSFICLKTNKHV